MINILRPRRSGKTTDLIRICAEQGGYIVCQSKVEARRIFEAAQKMDLSIPFPITYDEFLSKRFHGKNCSPLHIDDADQLLATICGGAGATLGSITTTSED
jgi:hypothetical protein